MGSNRKNEFRWDAARIARISGPLPDEGLAFHPAPVPIADGEIEYCPKKSHLFEQGFSLVSNSAILGRTGRHSAVLDEL